MTNEELGIQIKATVAELQGLLDLSESQSLDVKITSKRNGETKNSYILSDSSLEIVVLGYMTNLLIE